MSLDVYPADELEHELESWSFFLRQFPDCPDEVRIREQEGVFMRPSILIRFDNVSGDYGNPHYWLANRALNIIWYGSPADIIDDPFLEVNRTASWLNKIFFSSPTREHGVIRVYDFSNPETPYHTGHWMLVDGGSVTVTPTRDDLNNWMISVDLRYTVERDTEEALRDGQLFPPGDPPDPVPLITGVVYRWELP